jgi:hypothetical protein
MAFLGALSVHKVELLELAVGQPALERYKRNPSFRGCFAPLRRRVSESAATRTVCLSTLLRGQVCCSPVVSP